MRRKKQTSNEKPIIDLTGPQGNAFSLMAITSQYLKQLEYSREEIDEVIKNMKTGDYEHLLDVMEEHLGDYIILEESIEEKTQMRYEMNPSYYINLVSYIVQNLPETEDYDKYNSWYITEFPAREGYVNIVNTYDEDLEMEIAREDMFSIDKQKLNESIMKEDNKEDKQQVINMSEKEVDDNLSIYIKDLLNKGIPETDILDYFKKI